MQNIYTVIKEGASIGANATITCRHTIGKGTMIVTGLVETKDILDYALLIEAPASQDSWVDEQENIKE